ncbi:Spo0E family sporulation regulatory protein-aspartic acid phosphatase [Clostridium sp. SHJSY1]|uniref:Spo0E family sporulation regulatory protein-aspartic acid phosphatase n=1 Tax=Clostridium sp. SHJSY1 TaxID=2942483 RepID=UPI002876892C|nr:Spo0E family sporulation regulatory protein-aspartic acid phosphatase [Clostridium sp. SHJSY1]
MNEEILLRQIARRKKIINFLIKYISPTNFLMVIMSKNLDKLISEYQKSLYLSYVEKSTFCYFKF